MASNYSQRLYRALREQPIDQIKIALPPEVHESQRRHFLSVCHRVATHATETQFFDWLTKGAVPNEMPPTKLKAVEMQLLKGGFSASWANSETL